MRREIREALTSRKAELSARDPEKTHKTFEDVRSGRMYTVQEVADLLKCSYEMVRQTFAKAPGVVRLGTAIRIPEHVLQLVLKELTIK